MKRSCLRRVTKTCCATRLLGAVLMLGSCLLPIGCGPSGSPREKRVEILLRQVHTPSLDERLAAIRELGRMREQSVAQPLIRLLYEPRGDVRATAAESLGRIGDRRAVEHIVKLLLPPHEWAERKAAAEALGLIGDASAVDPLIGALRDEKEAVAYAASVALSKIGSPAVAPVAEAFRSGTGSVKAACADAICLVRDREAAPALRAMLKDTVPDLRLAGAQALSGMKEGTATEAIVSLLEDKSPAVSKGVRQALVIWGADAVALVGKGLERGLKTTHGLTAAVQILDSIGTPATVRPLLSAMSHGDQAVSQAARKALRAHARNEPIARELRVAMRDDDLILSLNALLVTEPTRNEETISAIADALKSKDARVRRAAVDLLGAISSDTTLEPLVSVLEDKADLVRLKAASSLAARGDPRGRDAALAAAGDAAERVRKRRAPRNEAEAQVERDLVALAATTLARLKEPTAADHFIALLKHSDSGVVGTAVDTLGQLGEKRSAPQLVAQLQSKDPDIVRRSIKALGRIKSPDAVPSLIPLLQSPDHRTVSLTIEALGAIGHGTALDPLLALMKSDYAKRQREAMAALGHLGDSRAIPHLVPFLQPVNARLAQEARWREEDARLRTLTAAYEKKEAEWQETVKKLKESGEGKNLPPRPARPQAPQRPKRDGAPDFTTVATAVEALGNIGNPEAVPHLAPLVAGQLLQKGDRSPEMQALDALAKIGGGRAFEVVSAAFGKVSNHRYWHAVRLRVMRAVIKADREAAVPVLVGALEKSEPMDYDGIAGLLKMAGEIGDPQMFTVLVKYLRHDVPTVRAQARNAFAAIGGRDIKGLIAYMEDVSVGFRSYVSLIFPQIGPEAIPALVNALAQHKAPQVRQGAAWALGYMQHPDGVEALIEAVKEDKHAKARGAAIWALGQLADKRAVTPLVAALKDSDPEARMGAAVSLGQLADAAARDPLIVALEDEVAQVREAAALALGRIGDQGARGALKAAMEDQDGNVRGSASRALMMLDGDNRASPGSASG